MSNGVLKKRSLLNRPRLLPVFMVAASVAFVFKLGNLATDLTDVVAQAQAQSAEQVDEGQGTQGRRTQSGGPVPSGNEVDGVNTRASEPDTSGITGVSRSELDLLQDLRKRREQLEEREQKAALREQLLASTERRIDKKIGELRSIEENLQQLVADHKAQEDQQTDSIVKVYETMKPKDAAPIFQRLDMEIQQAVAMRMSDRKMAALMAEMDPDAAKTLTTLLATRTRLPEVAELVEGNDDVRP